MFLKSISESIFIWSRSRGISINQMINCFMAPAHRVVHNVRNNFTVCCCSVCQPVNRLPYLERSAGFGGPHLCCISDNLCCSNENERGHWFWSKGGRFPADWTLIDVLVDWRDNIVGDLCVSSKRKKRKNETITVSCKSHSFLASQVQV